MVFPLLPLRSLSLSICAEPQRPTAQHPRSLAVLMDCLYCLCCPQTNKVVLNVEFVLVTDDAQALFDSINPRIRK